MKTRLLILLAIAALLTSCALYKLNEQTKPQFTTPNNEPYPDGMSMEAWLQKLHILPSAQ